MKSVLRAVIFLFPGVAFGFFLWGIQDVSGPRAIVGGVIFGILGAATDLLWSRFANRS